MVRPRATRNGSENVTRLPFLGCGPRQKKAKSLAPANIASYRWGCSRSPSRLEARIRRIYQSGTPFQPLPTLRGQYTPPESAWTLAKFLASFLEFQRRGDVLLIISSRDNFGKSHSGARLTGLKRHSMRLEGQESRHPQ